MSLGGPTKLHQNYMLLMIKCLPYIILFTYTWVGTVSFVKEKYN